jgi:hypothetical protein
MVTDPTKLPDVHLPSLSCSEHLFPLQRMVLILLNIPGIRIKGKYQRGRNIGSGSFGGLITYIVFSSNIFTGTLSDIYLGINIILGEEVAVKAKHPQLEYESKVYKTLATSGVESPLCTGSGHKL